MLYKEYLNAARKHEYTCDVIYEKIKKNDCSSCQKMCLMLNLYYLSGYIIECIIKYAIYDLVGHKKEDDIKKLNKGGLSYDKHIKYHRFERYSEHLNRYLSVKIPLINDCSGIDREIIQLFSKWDSELRYEYYNNIKDVRHYENFYKYAKEIYKLIRLNTRG